MEQTAAEQNENELLNRIRGGDERAFLALYRQRQGAIYRFALHMAGSPSVAEDITQEVFLTLLTGNFGFDSSSGSLSSYLFGIARKLVLRHLRHGRRDVAFSNEEEEDLTPRLAVSEDLLEDLTRQEGIEVLRKAVLALPRKYREVILLCDLEEVDYADAAQALGCPIGTVRSRLHRARALLMNKLRKEHGIRPEVGPLKPLRCWT
jgi:RNA polymerase sigma-70 factor (ECF subfamily)